LAPGISSCSGRDEDEMLEPEGPQRFGGWLGGLCSLGLRAEAVHVAPCPNPAAERCVEGERGAASEVGRLDRRRTPAPQDTSERPHESIRSRASPVEPLPLGAVQRRPILFSLRWYIGWSSIAGREGRHAPETNRAFVGVDGVPDESTRAPPSFPLLLAGGQQGSRPAEAAKSPRRRENHGTDGEQACRQHLMTDSSITVICRRRRRPSGGQRILNASATARKRSGRIRPKASRRLAARGAVGPAVRSSRYGRDGTGARFQISSRRWDIETRRRSSARSCMIIIIR
jgi:hypothetical protein